MHNGKSLRCELQLPPEIAETVPEGDMCNEAFPFSLDGRKCNGLRLVPSITDSETCSTFCCRQRDCGLWQFCPRTPAPRPARHCSRWPSLAGNCFVAMSDDRWTCRRYPAPDGLLSRARVDISRLSPSDGWDFGGFTSMRFVVPDIRKSQRWRPLGTWDAAADGDQD